MSSALHSSGWRLAVADSLHAKSRHTSLKIRVPQKSLDSQLQRSGTQKACERHLMSTESCQGLSHPSRRKAGVSLLEIMVSAGSVSFFAIFYARWVGRRLEVWPRAVPLCARIVTGLFVALAVGLAAGVVAKLSAGGLLAAQVTGVMAGLVTLFLDCLLLQLLFKKIRSATVH